MSRLIRIVSLVGVLLCAGASPVLSKELAENEKEFYQEKIKEVEKERQQLLTDSEALEKFAREKYLMKKESEDLFVVVEE